MNILFRISKMLAGIQREKEKDSLSLKTVRVHERRSRDIQNRWALICVSVDVSFESDKQHTQKKSLIAYIFRSDIDR